MARWRAETGQAGVELVAVLPCALVVCALVWQLALAGHAAWAVSSAARAAARAQAVGADPRAGALRALPAALERGLVVRPAPGGASIVVSVRVPSVGGLVRLGSVSARAAFASQAG
jgi:hypothetical protein